MSEPEEKDPHRPLSAPLLTSGDGMRVAGSGGEMVRALRFVLEAERAGTWSQVLKQAGIATGKAFAMNLDARFSAAGNLSLASMPLAACLEFLVRHVVEQGWGQLAIDASGATEQGLVVARLGQSFAAEALNNSKQPADPLLAGMLQGYFEHVTGQALACEEIACMSQGAPHCTFVLATPDRLQPILPFIGRESAEEILARLRT
jgi:predicted hydrocarbon binding protein